MQQGRGVGRAIDAAGNDRGNGRSEQHRRPGEHSTLG